MPRDEISYFSKLGDDLGAFLFETYTDEGRFRPEFPLRGPEDAIRWVRQMAYSRRIYDRGAVYEEGLAPYVIGAEIERKVEYEPYVRYIVYSAARVRWVEMVLFRVMGKLRVTIEREPDPYYDPSPSPAAMAPLAEDESRDLLVED